VSFLTGTNTELIYASTAAFTAANSFTAATCLNNLPTNITQCYLPPSFWLPNQNQVGRGIRIVARGLLSTNTTVSPTYTFQVALGPAGSSGTPVVLGSPAIAVQNTSSNAYWELQGDVVLTQQTGVASTATVQGVGYVFSPAFTGGSFAAPVLTTSGPNFVVPIYGGSASPGTVATVNTLITNYVNIIMLCSASAVANSVTLNQLLVFGLN
jgi:hypothetical protein